MEQTASAILRRCGFFRNLTPASLARLEPITRLVTYRKDDVIFRQGDPCPGVYVVGEGAVRVFKIAPNGKEHVLHFAYSGMTFAEVAAIGDFPCPAHAQATEPTVCALVPKRDLNRALRDDHDLCLELITGMVVWVRQLVGLLEDVTLRDASGRVARHLIESDATRGTGDFALPMRKRDLASHLNLTSETLSRTLRRLVECVLIEMPDQHHIRIVNPPGLQDVADGILPGEFEAVK